MSHRKNRQKPRHRLPYPHAALACALSALGLEAAAQIQLPPVEVKATHPGSGASGFITQEATGAGRVPYRGHVAALVAILEANHRARQTRQKDGFTWQLHLLGHLRHYLAHRLPSSTAPSCHRPWADSLATNQ